MKLATIGAVLTFALAAEKESLAFWDETPTPAITEELPSMRVVKGKHLKTIEQIRRENVTEMILEPIAGLDSDDYRLPARLPAGATAAERRRFMVAAEGVAARYLNDAAQKVKQSDIARMLTKMAREKEALADRLEGMA